MIRATSKSQTSRLAPTKSTRPANRLALAAAAVVASLSVDAQAANKYWDTNAATANLQAGAGDWDASGGTNWANISGPAANTPLTPWVQGSDAFFQNGGVNTVNLIGTVQANSLTNTNGGTFTSISGTGTLELGTGGLFTSLSNGASIGVNVSLAANQVWQISSPTTVSGVVAGTGFSLQKIGSGTLTLTADNSYTGLTTLSGGQITLSGAGTIAGSSGLTIASDNAFTSPAFAQPYVLVDNTTTNLDNRLNGTLTLGLAGKLRINGNSGANTSESLGTFTFDAGQGQLELNGATAGRTVQVTASSLARSDNGTGAIYLQNGAGAPSQSKLTLTAAPSGANFIGAGGAPAGVGTTKDLGIVPWLVTGTNVAVLSTVHFATYDTTAGSLRRLEDAEYDPITATYAAAGNNVTVNSATTLTGADRDLTVNALRINGSFALTGRAGDTLTISSGALAQSSSTSTLTGFGEVTFGNDEGIVHAIGTVNINSPIDVTNGGGLTKAQNGTLVLGADNLYSGTTTVNGGTLQVGTGGTVGNLGTSSAIVLNGGNLTVNRSDAFNFNGTITGAVTSRDGTSGKLTLSGAGTTTLGGTNLIPGSLNVTNGKLVVSGSTTAGGPVHNAITTISSVVGGANTSTVLELTGTGSLTTNNTIFKIADGANSRARVYVPTGTSLTSGTIMVGNVSGGAGALYQTGGTVTSLQVTEPSLAVGASGGYGFYQQSGGTVSAPGRIRIGQGANSTGVYYQTGGSTTTQNFDTAGGGGPNTGIMYMTGGTFTATGGSALGYTAGRGEVTIADGAVVTANFTVGNVTHATGILNLNDGGVLQTTLLNTANNSTGSGVRHVNFNGGTLRYTGTTNATQFVNAQGATASYNVHVLAGGATFDIVNSTGNATISQPLVAPTGNGIEKSTYTIADGGSGYIGAPVVTINGVPGATAVANMVPDGNGTYSVGSITITSPGINAAVVNPTFTFSTVPGATAAVATTTEPSGALTTTANSILGGITKVGLGTLTLSAANTYAGQTTVEAGKLTLAAAGSIDNSSGVTVKSGATFDTNAKTAGYTVNGLAGAGTVRGRSGQSLAVDGILAPGDSVGTLTVSEGNLTLADGAAYNYEIGGTTASPISDLVNLTDNNATAANKGKVIFAGDWTLNLFNLGSVNPEGLSFVLFDYLGADPTLPPGGVTLDYGTTGWGGGAVSIDTTNKQVILSGLTAPIPEPAGLGVLLLGAATGLLGRRRRTH